MKKIITSVVSGIMLLGLGSAHADDDGLGLGLAVNTGTLGHGIQIGKSLTDSLNVRLGMNSISKSENKNIDGIDYKTDLDFSNNSLYLDWHPFEGTFHLTLGYVNSDNELSAHATPSVGTVVGIGSYTHTVASADELVLDGTVKLGSGPYLGLGWGNVPASGFGFSFEAGVVQMGTPDASLAASGTNTTLVNTLYNDGGVNHVAEEEANMQKELDEFEVYPVIAVGISYGF